MADGSVSAASDADAGAAALSSCTARRGASSLGLADSALSWVSATSLSSLCLGCVWVSLNVDLRHCHARL